MLQSLGGNSWGKYELVQIYYCSTQHRAGEAVSLSRTNSEVHVLPSATCLSKYFNEIQCSTGRTGANIAKTSAKIKQNKLQESRTYQEFLDKVLSDELRCIHQNKACDFFLMRYKTIKRSLACVRDQGKEYSPFIMYSQCIWVHYPLFVLETKLFQKIILPIVRSKVLKQVIIIGSPSSTEFNPHCIIDSF